MSQTKDVGVPAHNTVRLVGRVSAEAVEHALPSGDTVVGIRLVVTRSRTAMTSGSRQKSDWVDCAVWGGRVRRSVTSWKVGDVVEVEGALRRRFFRGDTGAGGRGSSRLEVEVLAGRRLSRPAGRA